MYYPIAYTSPPNLKLVGSHQGSVQIVEQKADHFRLKKTSTFTSVNVEWESDGFRPPSK